MSVSYSLPSPPTVNGLFVQLGDRRVKTKAYAAWRGAAGWEIHAQGRKRIKGEVAVLIEVRKPDKRRRDIDNIIKSCLDLMTELGVIEDDSMVMDVRARWVAIGDPCVVTVNQVPQTP